MAMSLYDLTGQMLQLQEMLEDDEIDQEVVLDTIEGIDYEIEKKADGYACIIKNFQTYVDGYKKEIDRLMVKKKSAERKIEFLKDNLMNAMQLTGKTNFRTERFKFRIQKNSAASVVMDEPYIENIPEEYLIYHDPDINRKKISDDIKAGKDLAWIAHLEYGEHLRIS